MIPTRNHCSTGCRSSLMFITRNRPPAPTPAPCCSPWPPSRRDRPTRNLSKGIRNPKQVRNSKLEKSIPLFEISDFEYVSDFGFRALDFGGGFEFRILNYEQGRTFTSRRQPPGDQSLVRRRRRNR